MQITYGIILSVLYILFFIRSYRVTRDIFSPLCFFTFMQLIAYVPGITYFESHLGIELDATNTFYVFIMQIIVLLCTWFGIKIYRTLSRSSIRYELKYKFENKIFWVGVSLFLIGFLAAIYFIVTSGGLQYILSNTQLDYAAGRSYLLSLQKLMVIGILCLFATKKKPNLLFIYLGFGLYALTVVIFTKRAPIMEALMLLVFAYHYRVKKIQLKNFFKPKVIILAFCFVILIVLLPTLRNPAGFATLSSPKEVLMKGLDEVDNVFQQYSYTSRDAFVYTNYSLNNMYYGKTIINFLAAPLPSALFPWKPPVDDGVYLANFVNGFYVTPPSNNYPINNSYPFSTQGSMYANFGWIGVVFGAIIMGLIYAHAYRMLRDSNYNVFMIFIYQTILYKFGLSAKNITQTLILILLLVIFLTIFMRCKLIRTRVHQLEGEA